MNTDETSRAGSSGSEHSREETPTAVVLVADSDPAVTDEIAAVLWDNYTVRSAYESADVLASLDSDVSVALLDPDIPGLSMRRVLERVRTDAADCQVAALTDEALDVESTAFDDYLVKPVADDLLEDTVDRLSRRATYRTTLEAYYRAASERADAEEGERADLDRRLAELDERLDDVVRSLDSDDAYDAALRELDVDP
ncbi:DNA-binding protein [Halosimplex aquaticum]|uniref:DNA-binding protein n=1 Tax=Halosimplex aquaticum TaxID=3026162 RepID=A0ABD5YBG7_9EURY|nr:DNA-binding protein [Halosimplex aquaticum]